MPLEIAQSPGASADGADAASGGGASDRGASDRGAEFGRYVFDGHIDFYGYHARAAGWFVGGWIAHPWPPGYRPHGALATFDDATSAERTLATFYEREDVSGRGIGFVFFFSHNAPAPQVFCSVRIDSAASAHTMFPTLDALALSEAKLVERLLPTLAWAKDGAHRRQMRELLLGEPVFEDARGFVDYYGYHTAAGGWLFCAWATSGWSEDTAPARMTVCFQDGDLSGEGFAATFPRPDLADGAEGVTFFVRGPARLLGGLCSVSFEVGTLQVTLFAASMAQRLREGELLTRLRPVLGNAAAGRQRDVLHALLARRPFGGEDTLASLDVPVFLEIDEAIRCGAGGLVLIGWCLMRPHEVRAVRLRSGPLICDVDFNAAIRIDRPDVAEGFAAAGFDDPRCGFMVFLPHALAPEADGQAYLEVETARHAIGYRRVPRPRLEGIAAIRRVLSTADVRFADAPRAYDRVLGPAVEGLNAQRLASRPAVSVVEYGRLPAAPRFSVIVPLYGRLDFVEYQLALFSAHPACAETEFIYVLDDPPRRAEAQQLFASVHARFQVPFRVLLLDRNVGFAPANNIGLAHAAGATIAYLNSDVFPGTLDWLERLGDRLAADPTLGVIAPTLLFEDGTVQHRGMSFTRLAEFGDWFYGQHPGKGMRQPPHDGSVERCLSVTGAAMVLRRSLAEKLGGFDEVYVVGDFEDSDLCLKLRAMGLSCGVDPTVQLFHLERKSQASSSVGWRMNLTLYNAWQHDRRWGETIARAQEP